MSTVKKDMSVQRSLPVEKNKHGIVIKKTPMGRYLKAMEQIKSLPSDIMSILFPGASAGDVLNQFATIDESALVSLAGRALIEVPEYALRVAAELLDVSYDTLVDGLTPTEILEVLKEWYALNDLTPFFEIGRKWIKKFSLTGLTSPGSSDGSQSA